MNAIKQLIKEIKTHPRAFISICIMFCLSSLLTYFSAYSEENHFSMLFIVPIIIAAISWGRVAALMTCFLSFVFLAPYIKHLSEIESNYMAYINSDLFIQVVLSFGLAYITGTVTDKEHREQEQQNKLANKLKKLNRELDRRVLYLTLLYEVGKEISYTQKLEDLLGKVMDSALKVLDAQFASLWMVEKETEEIVCKSAYGVPLGEMDQIRMKLGQGISGSVALTGRPRKIDDLNKDPNYLNPLKRKTRIKTQLSIPLKVRDEVIGVLNVFNKSDGELFTDEDLDLLYMMGGQVAIGAENAKLLESTRQRLSEASLLFNLSQEMIAVVELEDIFDVAVKGIKQIANSEMVALFFLDDDNTKIKVGVQQGISEKVVSKITDIEGSFFTEILNDENNITIFYNHKNERIKNFLEINENLTASVFIKLKPKNSLKGILLAANKESALYPQEEKISSERIYLYSLIGKMTEMALEKNFLYHDLIETNIRTMQALAFALDARDSYTAGHAERTVEYAIAIAEAINLPEKEIKTLRYAAALHDVGKIGISDNILNKPEKLTVEEFEVMKKHVNIGADIVAPVEFLKDVIPLIYHHHERFDGKGYPVGLKGEEIPLCARILCIVDAFEAMTSDRPYRKAFQTQTAIDELKSWAGVQFDPNLVDVFIDILSKEMGN